MTRLNHFEKLDDLLEATALENLCTDMFCGTCGAGPFRQKLADFVAEQMRIETWTVASNSGDHRLKAGHAETLLNALRQVTHGRLRNETPGAGSRRSAIMFILRDIWYTLGGEGGEPRMIAALNGTYSGTILDEMISHYRAMNERHAKFAVANSPVEVAKRRGERKREKLGQIDERMRLKTEIDRKWRERQAKVIK